ncbi:uncharacterized protein LOC127620084 [Xyrauchen texanus]|uniref:uncharacterized protein LOC127620084 n=1 Tax=Xyrauchen texanus TaxID=154827 RepID=UPI0022426B5A|nr:uncharacterized protein LOC127620084 [Xyrauchen texanus]
MGALVILLLTLLPGLFIADLTENLALRANAVQSSTGDPKGDAQHAVDGNRNTYYHQNSCTHSQSESDPWWRVDLTNNYNITKVTITHREDCCKWRILEAQIRVGNSLDKNGNNNELAATVATDTVTQTFEFKPINGRYVNIYLPGNQKILTLCEVEVFAEKENLNPTCVPRNLALGTKAVQSSTYNEIGDAQNAIDGKSNSNYMLRSCTHTQIENDPWWRVDLLEVYIVTKVTITNRGDCCEERIEGAQIRIGNSLENNGNNNELASTVSSIPPGGTKTFKFKPIKGRYVNIFLSGGNKILTLCEVQVFAD